MRFLIISIIFFYYPLSSKAINKSILNEDKIYKEMVNKKGIKTVLLHKSGWDLSHPIITIGSNEQLELSFDDLNESNVSYNYTFFHCDKNWYPTSINTYDYLEGFAENEISNYKYSKNTTQPYIHYKLSFPNENVQFKISGNYVIVVYEDFDPEKIVLIKRFYILDPKVGIYGKLNRREGIDPNENRHEIDFEIDYGGYAVGNPYQDIEVRIMQNNRYDNMLSDMSPDFINDNILRYDMQRKDAFLCGNEFRSFDIKSVKYKPVEFEKLEYQAPYFHFMLSPITYNPYDPYLYYEDLNGEYYIETEKSVDREVDADYVVVHFSLQSPILDGNVYVFGALTDWVCTSNNIMKYDFERKIYSLSMLLKQGYYNYEFVLIENGAEVYNNIYFEGNHIETENSYYIYVYHSDPNLRYDQLIGVEIINSLWER